MLTGDSFFHLNALGERLPGLNMCGAGRVVCLIDPLGDVYACPFVIHEQFRAGSVRDAGGFTAVWRESALFRTLREPNSAGACASCGSYDACQGGCMAAKFFTGLPPTAPTPSVSTATANVALARVGAGAAPRPVADHSRPVRLLTSRHRGQALTMWVALVAAAYLLGTFPSAALVASASGVDITTTGSGNPGASNVTRTLGWRKGVLVFVLDALKGCARRARRAVDGRAWRWLRPRRRGDRRSRVPGHPPAARRQGRGDRRRRPRRAAPDRRRASPRSGSSISRLTGKAAVASIAAVIATPDRPRPHRTRRRGSSPRPSGSARLLVVRHAGNMRRMLRREEPSSRHAPVRPLH